MELQSDQEQYRARPLPVDPIFLTRKKEWGRNSLAHNARSQLTYDKDVACYERDMKKAVNQLQNSKSYHTQVLNKLRERQMQICKDREKEVMLKQAQHRYDKAPILETKRFCGACARRPKSAKASCQVTVDGLLRLPQNDHNSSKCKQLTFSSYEQRQTPPKPLIRRQRSHSAQLTGKAVCFDEKNSVSTEESGGRSIPSPIESSGINSDPQLQPRPVSPLRSYDSSIIPDRRNTALRPKTGKPRIRLQTSTKPNKLEHLLPNH